MTRVVAVLVLVFAACTSTPSTQTAAVPTVVSTTTSTTTSTTNPPPTTSSTTTTTTTTIPSVLVDGIVTTADGAPLDDAVVTSPLATATSNDAGAFTIELRVGDTITVGRPAWLPGETVWEGGESLDVVLEPRVVNAIRVSRYVAMEPDSFSALLEMADGSAVNALIFDTKDETGQVLYNTAVEYPHDIGAVADIYDPAELIALADAHGLYTITRLVSFEDPIRVQADPDTKLAGAWVDMSDPANWAYILDLATEACELGFDEIQFDYVRFPAGITGAALVQKGTFTEEGRIAAITAFLAEARSRLHPMRCAVAADVFGIIMSSPNDEGIGQKVEETSAHVDVLSPMVYPSHYSPGWLGFGDPNDHPGPVVADALAGADRMDPTTILRPWLQAFYYSPAQIGVEISEATNGGYGWMLWNAGGEYNPNALPSEGEPLEEEPAEDG
ncbi:MAG: hypothetical protein OEM94_02285 [Acidimicrobiia bacterium]|nr:hypothetical protein [Acidimicrobiia bacterium]